MTRPLKKTLALFSAFILSAVAFVAIDLATAREADAADPQCPNKIGMACVNGDCVPRGCQTPGTWNKTCQDFDGGTSCIMGIKCWTQGPCPG